MYCMHVTSSEREAKVPVSFRAGKKKNKRVSRKKQKSIRNKIKRHYTVKGRAREKKVIQNRIMREAEKIRGNLEFRSLSEKNQRVLLRITCFSTAPLLSVRTLMPIIEAIKGRKKCARMFFVFL